MQFCVFVPTVGGESANLHPDSRKPRATNPKSANVSRTDTEDYIQSSAITRRLGPRFRESYIKLQTYIGGGRRRGQPANALFFCQSRKEECNVHSRNLGPVALRRSPLNIIAPGLRFTQVLGIAMCILVCLILFQHCTVFFPPGFGLCNSGLGKI